jgi:hypothetical protein
MIGFKSPIAEAMGAILATDSDLGTLWPHIIPRLKPIAAIVLLDITSTIPYNFRILQYDNLLELKKNNKFKLLKGLARIF